MERGTVGVTGTAEDRLAQIRSLTEGGLAHLGTDELLAQLLDRTREILGADTAAVLLLREGADEVVATAARGLEEEVHQNVRIPLGRGFAGRIADERVPVAIEDVDHSVVLNPLLRAKGIRSLLGVPLFAAGDLLGVLHVGTLTPRRFTAEDTEILQLAADRVALAVGAQRATTARTASVALQKSLEPVVLPQVPGLEMAGRYVPAEDGDVGGDWYDVFTLPTGHLCVAMGDVVGRGLHAAVVMGRLRSTLRAYSLDQHDPAEVIQRVDRKLIHFEPSEMATLLLAVVDPSLETMRVAVAGHPPPLITGPDGPGHYLDLPVDPPLGVRHGIRRRSTVVPLPMGSAVCFFTDGLVERRTVSLDERLELLRTAVRASPPDAICTAVMSRLIGSDPPTDDVALLALRRLDDTQFAGMHLEVPADSASLASIRSAVRRWLTSVDAGPGDVVDWLVAIGEASSNAIEHAYGPRPGTVDLRMEQHPTRGVVATVRDTGTWRSARGANRGRGLPLIEGCTDSYEVRTDAAGTEVVMYRHLSGPVAQGTT